MNALDLFKKAQIALESSELLADYKGEEIAAEKAHWALNEARVFVLALQKYNQP